jgi:hypothetical protein
LNRQHCAPYVRLPSDKKGPVEQDPESSSPWRCGVLLSPRALSHTALYSWERNSRERSQHPPTSDWIRETAKNDQGRALEKFQATEFGQTLGHSGRKPTKNGIRWQSGFTRHARDPHKHWFPRVFRGFSRVPQKNFMPTKGCETLLKITMNCRIIAPIKSACLGKTAQACAERLDFAS